MRPPRPRGSEPLTSHTLGETARPDLVGRSVAKLHFVQGAHLVPKNASIVQLPGTGGYYLAVQVADDEGRALSVFPVHNLEEVELSPTPSDEGAKP